MEFVFLVKFIEIVDIISVFENSFEGLNGWGKFCQNKPSDYPNRGHAQLSVNRMDIAYRVLYLYVLKIIPHKGIIVELKIEISKSNSCPQY